jgi:uncharacterized integral membrane protein
MGYKQEFQPLTREDKATVVLYRAGIVLSSLILSGLAYLLKPAASISNTALIPSADILLYCLYASVGMSVFFIHLYIRTLKIYLKILYFISLGCLVALLFIGKGSLSGALMREPYSSLLLLPLSGCLGFVAVKEAFCFQLVEGHLLGVIMPVYLLLISSSVLTHEGASYGLVLIAVLFGIFTLRKAFMPLAWDIGDKSAYH